ncbi:toprim domain-containing protein [Pseudomonas sp. MAHUQ-62]|uniref:toprim domain-containing protein n=1 Tax=Pseudomonas sp. GCM10023245 TaxID=3252652 RepID=UPI00360F11F8
MRVRQAREQRDVALFQRHQEAREHASKLWDAAHSADPRHRYLQAKGVRPHGLRQLKGLLLVPLVCEGKLVNLQSIHEDGTKRFLAGGRVKSAYSFLGAATPGTFLYICEGWVTGATIHEHTGAAVACAMNAGNLLEVGRRLQGQYPDVVLVVAGDDDRLTEGNPGRTAANNAAVALGCGVVFPRWSGAEPLELSDFNDLARWRSAQ